MHHIYCSQETERWTRSGKDAEFVCASQTSVNGSIYCMCQVHCQCNETSLIIHEYKIVCVCVCVCQDGKLRDVLGIGKADHVEGKLITIVYGNDLVNISFLNFQAMHEDAAKVIIHHHDPIIFSHYIYLHEIFLPSFLSSLLPSFLLIPPFFLQAIC